MTNLKSRLPIKVLSVFMALLMIFSTMSIMFTVSAVDASLGGGNGEWVDTNGTITYSGHKAYTYVGSTTFTNQSTGYAVYLPENYQSYADKPAGKKLATMLVMSGGTESLNGNYYAMANASGLNYLADEKGIIVIYLRQNNTTVNSSYYWNWWQASNNTRDTTSNYIGQKATELVSTIQSRYSQHVDTERTYVTGLSAGAAMASNFAALYPDVFKGAAIVAGLPFKTVTNTNAGSNYTSAYGAQGTQTATGWTQDIPTLGGFITTAWSAAGVAPENATRVIAFHGTADQTVYPRNGKEIADANAYARYGENYSQKLTTTETDNYTVYSYGVNQSMLEAGYSRDRASDVVFYEIDGFGHNWYNNHANGNYGVKSAIIDYNEVMWEFFEGTPDYADADDPITPDGETVVNATYGAKFCVQNGKKYADLVTSQGLKVLDLPLSPDYLMADTDPTTASEWTFNFDLTEAIDAAKAANLDTLKDVYIKSIKVYQNVWAVTAGSSVNLGYTTVVNPVISQGGSNATDISSTKLLESWTAEYPMDTYQLYGKITDPTVLNTLMNYGYLSLVTYGTDGNVNFNVAAPIISIEFGKKDRDLDVEVEGDVLTARNSYPVFPVFAYNSAAGYNAPTSAANETKVYGDKQGHLIGTASKYSVGVYNAGDNNDTMYYSYNLADYTKNNGYSVQSITIKYSLEGNPYYSKEDVGVKISVAGNQYWETADEAPTDMHVIENFTIAKGEKVEGEITISFENNEHKSIINYVNNAGGFTLAFENTSNNPHYYFLITVPTIIVNYENIPGTPQSAITGIGVRYETSYDDLVDDGLFESGKEEPDGSVTVEGSLTSSKAEYANSSDASAGTSNATSDSTARSNYRTTFGSYDIYNTVKDDILNEIKAKYPGMTEGVDYWITLDEVKLVYAKMTLGSMRSNRSYGAKAYAYYHPTAQSSNDAAFASTAGTVVIDGYDHGTSDTNSHPTSADFTPNMVFTEDAPYLWTRAHSGNTSNSTRYYLYVSVPQISDIEVAYKATVTTTKPVEDDGGDGDDDDQPQGSLSDPYTVNYSSGYYTTTWTDRASTSASKWTNMTGYTNGTAMVSTIVNYDLVAIEAEIKAYIIAQTKLANSYNEYFDVEVTNFAFGSFVLKANVGSATSQRTVRVLRGDTAYNAYNSAMSTATEIAASPSNSVVTFTVSSIPSGTGQYLSFYALGSNSANGLTSKPTATITYTYSVKVTDNTPAEPEPDQPGEEDVIKDAVGNSGTFTPGISFDVEGDYYTDYRVVTSSTSETTPISLSRPVDGYIVGTNSKYYTGDSSDYFTSPLKSTGSPQANVALDVTKATFPVSYLGYAYMNYDVSSYFAKEKPLTLVSEVVGEQQDVNGVPTQVTIKTYTETVVSSIRINSVKAQEGYTGGLAASYTVTGSTWAAGTSKWTSTTTKPTNYQTLGSGSVTSSQGNISASANLNATQMEAAKQNGYVTVWVNNDDNDWYSYYDPSAWLLVQMPEVIVTYKTITYTEKHITEIKDRNTQTTSDSSTEKIIQTGETKVTASQNGYIYGSNSAYYGNTYRTTQGSNGTENYTAQANVALKDTTSKFAAVYLGKTFVDYNLESQLQEGTTYVTTGPQETTAEIHGKPTKVIKEVIDWTDIKITGISISGYIQSGYEGGLASPDTYSMTNELYVGGFPDWSSSTYPDPNGDGWQLFQTLSGVGVITVAGTNFGGTLNADTFADVLETKHLTFRIDNTDNGWSSSYKASAWSLVTMPTITVHYTTTTWTQTKITSTQDADSFNPQFKVYAQYRFTDGDGASLSKTKYIGATEGYGATGIITPYVVDNGATLGQVNALFVAPVNPGSKPTNSVLISENASKTENYVLKRAYVEDTGEEIAEVIDNGDGTFTLRTLLDENVKTNDTYRIRIIFEYESEAQTAVDQSDLVKVNLHSVFENFDLNGNSLGQVGTVTETAFAKLTNSSYVLSLDDIDIPYGDMVVNGQNISAVRGSNRVYNLNNDKTTITLKNSSGTLIQSTANADDCTITANNNMAKVYLDYEGDAPRNGDILVVTYNGDASVAGGTIDVYLHYESTPEYNIAVNYEFDIVDGNGNSLAASKYTYSTNNSYSVGSIVLPYDALATSDAEMAQFSKVSLTLDGITSEYKVADFVPTVVANGVELNDEYRVTSITSATPTVTIKYQLVLETETTATVHHVYKLVYGGVVVGTVSGYKTQANLTAPAGGSVEVVRNDMDITYPSFGSFTASQFTPVSITCDVPGITFGTLANNAFAATAVPYNTPNADITITYELVVRKITVNESFKLNGNTVGETVETSVYAPADTLYTYVSELDSAYQPNNDGIYLNEYVASSSDVTLTNTTGGSVKFDVVPRSDMTVDIVYNAATFAQAPVNVVHQFYKNDTLVGQKTISNITTLTNDPSTNEPFSVPVLSGEISGISGSISSAIVDANNYYANGMSSKSNDVSVSGYTIEYINTTATGPQDAIDVYVRYDITDKATVTVQHVYFINGVMVTGDALANVTTGETRFEVTAGVSHAIATSTGRIVYNGTSFDLSKFTATASTSSNGFAAAGTNVTLNAYNITSGTVIVRYDLTVRAITVVEKFLDSTGELGTVTTVKYVANNDPYTFTSNIKTEYDGIAIGNFSKSISNGYTLNAGTVASFSSTATADATVTITYFVGTKATVTVNHQYFVNGNPVNVNVTNQPTTSLELVKGVGQSIVTAQGTATYMGTEFDLADFTPVANTSSAGIGVAGLNVTLNEFNITSGVVTVQYNLIVFEVNVTETFVKDGVQVESASKTVYIKRGDSYTFESGYKAGNIIKEVALGDYIMTATGATVTTAGNGAATFKLTNIAANANVAINYNVSTKTTADVEYVFIVNGTAVSSSAFTGLTQGASEIELVYGQAVSTPSLNGTYVMDNDAYTLAADFTKIVSVSGANASVVGTDVVLNEYNVANNAATVTVTYEIKISKEADVNIAHKYFINGTELVGSAIDGVTAGTSALNLVYGEPKSFQLSTGNVVYNGTTFKLSQFETSVSCDPTILAVNGQQLTLIKHNVVDQNITVRYDLTVYTVIVNEVFFINGVQQDAVSNTYYISAVDAALSAGLVDGSYNVNGIAASNFITSVSDNSNAIDGTIFDGKYIATVNGDGIVTVAYNLSTITNVNITSKFTVNGSTEGVDTTYVTNATSVQSGFEYGVSKEVTSLAGGYVIWNGATFNVSDFTATITNYDAGAVSATGLNVTVNQYNLDSTNIEITYNIVARSVEVIENFIVDGNVIETQVTTKWFANLSDYKFTSIYGSDYAPAGVAALQYFTVSSDIGVTKNSDGYVEFTGTAIDSNKTVTINYNLTTKANVAVRHEYFFNGDPINPNITGAGSDVLNLTYGVPASIALTQGTYMFNNFEFKLSDAKITVIATDGIIVNGTDVTLNLYNATAQEIVVKYELTTFVVTVTQTVSTDGGRFSETIGTKTYYLLAGETFNFVSDFDPSEIIRINYVDIPFSLFNKTVTGTEGLADVVVDTSAAVSVSGKMDGQNADIVIVYDGVTTTANIEIDQVYKYKTSKATSKTISTHSDTASARELSVGDRIQILGDRNLTFSVNSTPNMTVNSQYFTLESITASGVEGHIDDEGYFVITALSPNLTDYVDVTLTYTIDVYSDIQVVHEFYLNNKLTETLIDNLTGVVPVSASATNSTNFKIIQKTSGTIQSGTKSYNISDFIVSDDLIQTYGLTIKRATSSNHTDKFAVQSYDYSTGERKVVIRYDLVTTFDGADVTINSHYVNNGNYIESLFNSTVSPVELGDTFTANTVIKNVNGANISFVLDSVVTNGVTVEYADGVYTITEISPDVDDWSIDFIYTASVVVNVKVAHKFYVAGKLVGSIDGKTVAINPADASDWKFNAYNGMVAIVTESGRYAFVDASRFTTSADATIGGTFADGAYTLSASAIENAGNETYTITFNYNVDGMSYVVDGEVGVQQVAGAIDNNGNYGVTTTITSTNNSKSVDLVFVVDISAAMAEGITDTRIAQAKTEIAEYIRNSFAANGNVRVAIVTYAADYTVLTGTIDNAFISNVDDALAIVDSIDVVKDNDGYDVTTSNLQAGLYAARSIVDSAANAVYTDVVVITGSTSNAAYEKLSVADDYKYGTVITATAADAQAGADWELDRIDASTVTVIDLANVNVNIDNTMTDLFNSRNYIDVDGTISIIIDANFNLVEGNGIYVNDVLLKAEQYDYNATTKTLTVDLGAIDGTIELDYTVKLINTDVDGDYFVSDEIKVTYTNSISGNAETVYGVSARVNYNTTTAGATITVIPYRADSNKNPIGMDGITIKQFREDAIIGEPIVYKVSGVTNLTTGTTYTVSAPIVAGYTRLDNEDATKTVEITEDGGNFVVYFAYSASGTLVDDSVAYDNTSSVEIDVLANDSYDGKTFTAIYGIGATEADAADGNTALVDTTYGKLAITANGTVVYTSNKISAVTDVYYYAVNDNGTIRTAKIYVVPASIIKTDASDAQLEVGDRWQIVDNSGAVVEKGENNFTNDVSDIHGGVKDDDEGNFGFDGGEALLANRYKDYMANNKVDGSDPQYTTTFTFEGTGFDIISVTGRNGGYMVVETYNSNGDLIKDASGNILTYANSDNVYQSTVFTCTTLTHDVYTVKITAARTFIPMLGMTTTEVYVDSIRVYNPFGESSTGNYDDIHDGTSFVTLRDLFTAGKLGIDNLGDGLYTISGKLNINDYASKSTNYAINLVDDQAMIVELSGASAHSSFQIEMAGYEGAAEVEVYVNSKLVETIELNTGIFAYYDFSSYIREDSTVKIKVVSGNVTLTKVRYKGATLVAPESGEKYQTGELVGIGSAPDSALMTDDYRLNTATITTLNGSRTFTAVIYTNADADTVIAYVGGFRLAPSTTTSKVNNAGGQRMFIVTYTIPADVEAGDVSITFYAHNTAENAYSTNCKMLTYTIK
ncbi:MAG: VWA domain-containing protein [Clostridia bacterium]|nr:VWA domain-containing protein [Clostridia bacterium]